MNNTAGLDLVLVWHMHQPDYRDYATGQFVVPWVYLHAIKDYSDMAGHLERHPGVRAVVNFSPVLLDQIEDYADQFRTGHLRDPLLALLAQPAARPLSLADRLLALNRCFHANHLQMIAPYAQYRGLYDLFKQLEPQGEYALRYLSDQYVFDLLTWYHLSWLGETIRRETDTFRKLSALGHNFGYAERMELYSLIGDTIRELIARFRRLAERGKVELSTSPQNHPLAPLLIDFRSAKEALSEVSLPAAVGYPGGYARVERLLRMASESHLRRFAALPNGMWPAEGAISDRVLALFAADRLKWTASSESVLANSLRAKLGISFDRARDLYRPYHIATEAGPISCFFRDERLSDLIGFHYAKWSGEDAAENFVRELEAIAAAAPANERPVVSVILDGENAWEYFPYNAFYFLSALYGRLESNPIVRTHSFRSYLAAREDGTAEDSGYPAAGTLSGIVAGSWVYGDFSTWIGSPEKNRAWDLLVSAKERFDKAMTEGQLPPARIEAATRQLTDCEASDWFWWMGDYNPADAVATFDQLYRMKLSNLYRELQVPAPLDLLEKISRGGGIPETGGTMRRAAQGGTGET
jgi:alpha-amylase/alpha-mannosidase (GH57 family)